jgi:hypothetical protein
VCLAGAAATGRFAVTVAAPERPRETAREQAPRRRRAWLPIVALYVAAVAYHSLQSLGHRTPAVFTDELLFAKLAQSLAAGDWFTLRGEPFFYPAPVAVVLQAPAWLLADARSAYEVAKVLNAAVMATAVFPVYWLAGQLTGRTAALVAAAATVAAPGLLYHSYLMTDAAGYPAFLLTLAVMTRALARPSRWWEVAVVGASLLAVLTRTQFLVLPLAYLAAVGLVGRMTREGVLASFRRHRLSCVTLASLGALIVVTGGAVLGQYGGATRLDYPLGDVAHWTALSAGMLPFSTGWLVAPGAVLGIGVLLWRPRTRAEAAFAALVAFVVPLLVVEAALIATGDAQRVMERYLVCLVPVAFVAFLAYVERGAPARVLYAGLALGLGLVALTYPFATEADYLFSFDSPTMSAFGELARRLTEGDAAGIFAAAALVGSIVLAVVAPRGRAGVLIAGAGVVVLATLGATAYAADRAMTERTRDAFAASPPNWLDDRGGGRADYLVLAGAQAHAGWNLETWNRDFGLPIRFGEAEPDGYRSLVAHAAVDGRLDVDPTRMLVVNDFGSRIELAGRVVARPRPGLSVWELDRPARVRWLVEGLYHDGWASALTRYRVWGRAGGGVYRARLSLPAGRAPRTISLSAGSATRTVALRGGESVRVALPTQPGAAPAPLELTTDRGDSEGRGGPAPRLVAVRISALSYTFA